MDDKQREEIANFRYSLISPIVCRTNLDHGERYALLKQIAKGRYEIPYSTRTKVGLRTLERYMNQFQIAGADGLKPTLREPSKRIPNEYLDAASALKRENPRRSIETIITMLEQSRKVPEGVLKRSTLYDYFKSKNLSGKQAKKLAEAYRKYAAEFAGEILQGDVHHTMYIPDPTREGYQKKVLLFAWLDDFSRLVFGEFYFSENLPALENTLKKWVLMYGIPENIYVDNGAVYSSHHLQTICANLRVNLIHSRPYKPQGRGKIEKFFQFVDSAFKPEALLLVKEGKIKTLEELNSYFHAWVNNFYNLRIHSSTKQKPVVRFNSGEKRLREAELNQVYEAFLMEDEASVSKVGTIRLQTNEYEVESHLAGKKVKVRYDPYDLSTGIRIYYEDRRCADAVPAKIRRHHRKNYDRGEEESVPVTGLNHLELLQNERKNKTAGVRFADLSGKEHEE